MKERKGTVMCCGLSEWLPRSVRPELSVYRASRKCPVGHTGGQPTGRAVELSSWKAVERSEQPEPRPVFRETAVR